VSLFLSPIATGQGQASIAFQRPNNDNFFTYYKTWWRNYPNFSWSNRSNAAVPNSQPGMLPRNNSQPISHSSGSFQRPAFSGVPNAPRPPPPEAQVQPLHGYTDIDKIERKINSNMERMINAHMKRMMRIMAQQFFQLASSSGESGTFSSQPEVNP